MARKLLIAYIIYTLVVFLANTYIFKEDYFDAIIKAVLSGVVFTALYAYIIIKGEKRKAEEEEKNKKTVRPKK